MNEKPITYTLPNGKTLVLKYLTKQELDDLLKVPTTVHQAKKIRKRNLLLWKKFNADDTSESRIGCPHCEYSNKSCAHLCSKCAWQLYPDHVCCPCTAAYFGDTWFDNQCEVSYSTDTEQINYGASGCEDDGIEMIKNFLLGHVEWARAVILQGGIPWPNGKLTAKRQPLKQKEENND